jgi:hypothetical protein
LAEPTFTLPIVLQAAFPNASSARQLAMRNAQFASVQDDQTTFELWVPERLSLHDQPVALDIAMAIVLDALLNKEMFPDGFIRGDGGRYYKYRLER